MKKFALMFAAALALAGASFAQTKPATVATTVKPRVLAATAAHSVTLNWTASPDATAAVGVGYNVYRVGGACPATAPATTAGFTNVGNSAGTATVAPATSFVDSAVTAGQTYCYVVTYFNPTQESGLSNTAPATIGLAAPGNLTTKPQ